MKLKKYSQFSRTSYTTKKKFSSWSLPTILLLIASLKLKINLTWIKYSNYWVCRPNSRGTCVRNILNKRWLSRNMKLAQMKGRMSLINEKMHLSNNVLPLWNRRRYSKRMKVLTWNRFKNSKRSLVRLRGLRNKKSFSESKRRLWKGMIRNVKN